MSTEAFALESEGCHLVTSHIDQRLSSERWPYSFTYVPVKISCDFVFNKIIVCFVLLFCFKQSCYIALANLNLTM